MEYVGFLVHELVVRSGAEWEDIVRYNQQGWEIEQTAEGDNYIVGPVVTLSEAQLREVYCGLGF